MTVPDDLAEKYRRNGTHEWGVRANDAKTIRAALDALGFEIKEKGK